jgi:hypothetical protein
VISLRSPSWIGGSFPAIDLIAGGLGGGTDIETLEISRHTPDWTLGSFWAHPERVLDSEARAATSGFARMNPDVVERVVRSVRHDLESGAWDKRHGHLGHQDTLDVGLRLILNKPMPQPAD